MGLYPSRAKNYEGIVVNLENGESLENTFTYSTIHLKMQNGQNHVELSIIFFLIGK